MKPKDEAVLASALQLALHVELTTIPTYLTALYSIEEGTNEEAARLIESVVMEEMLHLVLVANIMNAVGIEPSILDAAPSYPQHLPIGDGLKVELLPFSRKALKQFRAIERPDPRRDPAPPKNGRFRSIGDAYAYIDRLLTKHARTADHPFPGDPRRQVGPNHFYYGSGGDALAVTDLRSAKKAVHEIVHQGEGRRGTIRDDTRHQGEGLDLAHYYRFDELYRGRHYRKRDTEKSGPTGAPLAVDLDAVHPMRRRPSARTLPKGSDLRALAVEFNERYAELLQVLHRAFRGEPHLLQEAVPVMIDLKWRAVALMRMPVSSTDRRTAGPSFDWPPPRR